jgi:hypothetical protein
MHREKILLKVLRKASEAAIHPNDPAYLATDNRLLLPATARAVSQS